MSRARGRDREGSEPRKGRVLCPKLRYHFQPSYLGQKYKEKMGSRAKLYRDGKKVFPRLREIAPTARGGITQPRTNYFGHHQASC